MVKTQTYSEVLNMACMLSLKEKKQLIKDMQINVLITANVPSQLAEDELCANTWDELRARIQESEEQIARGEVFSDEEDDRLFDKFLTDELGVAV